LAVNDDELTRIASHYEDRKHQSDAIYSSRYAQRVINEREAQYRELVLSLGINPAELRVLEIGAGSGGNIPFFLSLGIPAGNIWANELLPERAAALRSAFPTIHVIEGDARTLSGIQEFDIVFQSTVFTSILDDQFRRELASIMWNLVKPGGAVLWYDFTFDNPRNPNVKKVTRKEIRQLFPLAKDPRFFSVTLAPPLGRRVSKWYTLFNSFTFLRTHVIAWLPKK